VFRWAAASALDAFYQIVKRATLKSSSSLRSEVDSFTRNYHGLVCAIPDVQGFLNQRQGDFSFYLLWSLGAGQPPYRINPLADYAITDYGEVIGNEES
jgi:hypothetical protein